MKEQLKAIELVEGIKSGNVSCKELVWEIYERIERSELNCFITLNTENVVEKAREVDKQSDKKEKLLF